MRAGLIITLLLAGTSLLRAQDGDSIIVKPGDASQAVDGYNEDGEASEVEVPHTLVRPSQLDATRRYQKEDISVKNFNEEKWKKIVGDEKFQETPAKPRKEKHKQTSLSAPWAGALLKIVAYLVVLSVIGLVIYLVLKNVSLDVKIKREALNTEDLEKPVDDIGTIDIAGLLEQARRDGNFRLAVRLYYLSLLKKLHEMEKIMWKKDKTNRDYLGELLAKEFYYSQMRRLTLSYEAVWYGEHDLNPESFNRLSSQFESVFQELNTQSAQ
jgi:hypothetical protein